MNKEKPGFSSNKEFNVNSIILIGLFLYAEAFLINSSVGKLFANCQMILGRNMMNAMAAPIQSSLDLRCLLFFVRIVPTARPNPKNKKVNLF